MNVRLSAEEIGYISRHSGAKLLIVAEELLPSVPGSDSLGDVTEVVVIADSGSGTATSSDDGLPLRAYEEFRGRGSDEPLPWTVAEEQATISINYTSGTTGDPKGVSYTHRGAYLNSLGEIIHSGHSSASVYLWTLPMFHCNGWCTTWGVTAVGGTHVCLRAVRPDAIWRLIDAEDVTHLNGAPAVMTSIARAPEAHPFEHEVTVTTGGAAPSPTFVAEMEALGARVIHVYGLTEVYGPYSMCDWQPDWPTLDASARARKLARQGVGMVTTERVRVVDQDMNDVPADGATMGEIVMRGNGVMKGYFRDEEATELAFTGGWFHSGDLGVMHPDGYVELMDRAKDIVISGGENISTVEVEQALLSHPAVVDAAVIGIPDDRWGERPKAFVVLGDGQAADEGELIDHVRSRIAHYKAPDVIEFLTAVPRNSTGKVQKSTLRKHERDQSPARIG